MKKIGYVACLLIAAVIFGALAGMSQSQPGPEEYQAVAMGQGQFMGQMNNVTIHISSYSTDAERQALVTVFEQGGSAALSKALTKQPSHGNVEITGSTGVDIAYVRKMPGANGGTRIRILANKPLSLAGAQSGGISNDALSAIELDLAAANGKNKGTLLPACMFVVDKKTHELTVENYLNPWSLTDVKLRGKK